MTAMIDKAAIRQSLNDLIIEEPDFVDNLVQELSEALKFNKKKRLEQIVNEDFKEYESVFRALA